MYKLTRQEAADVLHISTRSIDRYIKSWRMRSKKEGKIVYIHQGDIDSLISWGALKQEIILDDVREESKKMVHYENKVDISALEKIYDDLRTEIQKKDQVIQTLSIRVGQSEEMAKNSISLLDYKKSQFLLEESKNHLNKELEDLVLEKNKLLADLKYEKKSNIILVVFVFILLILAGAVWFLKI